MDRRERKFDVDANGLRWAGWQTYDYRAIDREQVQVCRQFLAKCAPTKTGCYSSYALKHVIERTMGQYVSNGACIQAAAELGLAIAPMFHAEFRQDYPLNAWIGVSKRSVLRLAGKVKVSHA